MRKRFSLKKPIIVLVENAATQVGQIKRGPIDAQPQIDYLPRRVSDEIKIKPFDCAMELVSGSYRNIDFAAAVSVSIDPVTGSPTFDIPTLTDYANRDAELFAGTYPDNTKFKELKPSALGLNNYHLAIKTSAGDFDLNESNSSAYSDGWRIPQTYTNATDIRIAARETPTVNQGGLYFETLYIKGENSDRHKITTTYNYDAPSVSFSLGGQMEVYLIPRFTFQNLLILRYAGGPILMEILTPNYIFLDHEKLIESPTVFDGMSFPTVSSAPKIAEWAAKYPGLILWRDHNASRAVIQVNYNGVSYSQSPGSLANFLDTTTYPPPPGLPVFASAAGNPNFVNGSYSVEEGQYIPGYLVGIIKKGGTYYYFWNTVTG